MEKNHSNILALILSVTLLLASIPVAFTLTRPVGDVGDFDFIEHAAEATWESGADGMPTLPFPGSDDDDRGFALYVDNPELEDYYEVFGPHYDRVLETHPNWDVDGWIRGTYPAMTVESNTELVVSVGFLKDAAASDGVTFRVYFRDLGAPPGEIPQWGILGAVPGYYDGDLSHESFSLERLAGKTVQFRLGVHAGLSSSRDWAVWAKAEIRPKGSEDLRMGAVEAVQAIFGAPWLIKGKNTAFTAWVTSTFSTPVQTRFRLETPDSQWDTDVPGVAYPPGEGPPTYPKIWGPVEIPANAHDYQVMLPLIPDDQRDKPRDYQTNPAGIIVDWVDPLEGFSHPKVRMLPRPKADAVSFSIEVDPDNSISETNEENNRNDASERGVFSTKELKLYFVPWFPNLLPEPLDSESAYEYYLIERGYSRRDLTNRIQNVQNAMSMGSVPLSIALPTNEVDRLKRELERFTGHSLGCFPIADFKFRYRLGERLYFRSEYLSARGYNPCDFARWVREVRDSIITTYPDVDAVIFLDLFGWCGVSLGDLYVIELCAGLELSGTNRAWSYSPRNPNLQPGDKDYFCGCDLGTCQWDWGGAVDYTLAHELNHFFLGYEGECYACQNPAHKKVDCAYCKIDVEGFWTNKWKYYPPSTDYISQGVQVGFEAWNRLEPTRQKDGTINPDGYRNAINVFASSADPEAVIVRGKMTKDSQVTLDPFLVVSNATPDVRLGTTGDYYIVLKDPSGKITTRLGFNVTFYVFDPWPKLPEPVNQVCFNYRVPWKEGTRRIELQDRNGVVLASKDVSQKKPMVSMTYPNGGEAFTRGEKIKIRWTAGDQDGDLLTYSLAMRKQGSEMWVPIDIDITNKEYDLNTMTLESGQSYVVRVRATDGVNTVEDVSNGVFSIEGPVDLEFPYISEVTQEPEAPNNLETVTIRANVTDAQSGVKNATMSYSIDEGANWTNVKMNKTTGNIFEGEIPAQPIGTNVTYQIIAYDIVGNIAVEDNNGQYYAYTVQQAPLEVQWWIWIVVAAVAIISLAGAVYFLKKRKQPSMQTSSSEKEKTTANRSSILRKPPANPPIMVPAGT